jgi:hypothetical protein
MIEFAADDDTKQLVDHKVLARERERACIGSSRIFSFYHIHALGDQHTYPL